MLGKIIMHSRLNIVCVSLILICTYPAPGLSQEQQPTKEKPIDEAMCKKFSEKAERNELLTEEEVEFLPKCGFYVGCQVGDLDCHELAEQDKIPPPGFAPFDPWSDLLGGRT
jgi:hypothetical protein